MPMPLFETLIIDVGSSIAKSLIKLCLKDSAIAMDTSSGVVDVLKSWATDRVTRQKAQRQLEAIGEKVAENLLPLFESEGTGLDESSRIAVAKAVAETLSTITSQLATQSDLEPSKLANYLLARHPANAYHFSDTEAILYQRILSESSEYIVKIASQLPTFTEQAFAEVLKREGQLLSLVEQILQEVLRIREQLNPKTEAARFELDYRRAVIYKSGSVPFSALHI